jgi:hypothetical protein
MGQKNSGKLSFMVINSVLVSKLSAKLAPILILMMTLSLLGLGAAQTQTEDCEQCGMTVDATGQQRFVIIDQNGDNHIACCPICALKLLKTYPSLALTSFCDYHGPDYPILITATNHGKDVTVNPESAFIIVGGSCSKNRIVYDPEAADALLASPNNGTSIWLSPLSNDQVAKNATRLSIAQAVVKYSGLTFDSTVCEACGMTVSADSQARYRITDGQGNLHYVECFMCALELINQYDTLHIETTCDWYGPGYPIIVDSKGYGQTVNVNPSNAIFLRGGSCVTARVAYNQTAADNLLTNGFSQYASSEQHYSLPSTTEVKSVKNAIQTWYIQADTNQGPVSITLIFALVIGLVMIGGSVVAYKKLKH